MDDKKSLKAVLGISFLIWTWMWTGFAGSAMGETVAEDVEWQPMTMSDVHHGSLLLKTERAGFYQPAQSVETDVSIEVSGFLARTVVRQRFANPDTRWREGVYVFPLPSGSAVDAMRLVVGERVIEGEIQERRQAERTYEAAKRSGKKASLVEQQRPNVFTTSVANIGPGEIIDVVIEYQEALRYDSGAYRLRFPMVVNARYTPGGSEISETDPLTTVSRQSDALSSEAPTETGGSKAGGGKHGSEMWNPVNLGVDINAGLALAEVSSPSHDLRIDRLGSGRYRVELADGVVPANRDFVLEWRPEPGREPQAVGFVEKHADADYLMLMVMPPEQHLDDARIPRETIFVLDRSGSMSGAPMRQAKEALAHALDRLPPDDHFNVILFSSRSEKLFEQSVPATDTYRSVAKRRIESLSADGGTEMMGALELAFEDSSTHLGVRQVIFVTDGSVSNEDALFAYIRNHLGRSRLFTVGIGSAPNGHFMKKAAQFGGGTFTFIGDPREVASKMGELFTKIEHPVLRDLKIHWSDPAVETWPERPGDLYAGEPLIIAARSESGFEDLLLEGWMGTAPWDRHLILAASESDGGIDKLWGRKKIGSLMDRLIEGEDREIVREQVVTLGLRHHLVTKFTSLVAVDKTPSRPDHEVLDSQAVVLNRPAGVGGVLPQGGSASRLQVLLGLMLLLTAFGVLRLRS